MAFDVIDNYLISELQKNSRAKYVDIAHKLGMSEAGVRKRVSHLVEQGIIHLTAITNPGKVGYHSSAMIGLQVQMGHIDEVTKALTAHPNIQFVGTVAGHYDILISVICRSSSYLAKFIKDDLPAIKGISRAETFVILGTHKRAYWCIPDISTDDLPPAKERKKKT